MAKQKQKVESVSEIVRTSDGQTLRLTVSAEPVQRAARRRAEKFPGLRANIDRAHLAKMAEVTNA